MSKTAGSLVETKPSRRPPTVATIMVFVVSLIFGGKNATGCS